MGLPDQPSGPVPVRSLPAAPIKTFSGAHKGTVCSVAVMRPGTRCFGVWVQGFGGVRKGGRGSGRSIPQYLKPPNAPNPPNPTPQRPLCCNLWHRQGGDRLGPQHPQSIGQLPCGCSGCSTSVAFWAVIWVLVTDLIITLISVHVRVYRPSDHYPHDSSHCTPL